MDDQLIRLLDLCREPMIALQGATVVHVNPAAAAIFSTLTPGASAIGTLPDYLIFDLPEGAVTAVSIGGCEFTVSAARFGGMCLLSLYAERAAETGFVSDGLMNELRSSLFNIDLSARQLARAGESGDRQRFLAFLRHNYFRLARQLGNLGSVIQLREGAIPLHPRRLDLAAFCRELTDAVASLCAPELARLVFSTALPSLSACIDRDLIERLLLNLLDNSFRHCTPDGCVTLGLERKGERAILSVDDDGSGIPADVLQNVFRRYESRVRPDTLSRPLSGGLGLAVARGIAELHGGALIIESKPGRGTSVRVMLPLEQPGANILEDTPGSGSGVRLDTLLTELSGTLHASCYVPDEI